MNLTMNLTMLIICKKDALNSLVDELGDWHEEGAQIMLYGPTVKAREGFAFIAWLQPIPERFHRKLIEDEIVIDYFVIGARTTKTTTRPPVTTPPPA